MLLGLLGYPIGQSFSRPYFTEKFAKLGLSVTHEYRNFEVRDVQLLPDLIRANPDLRGLNVTIPHKTAVIPLLDELDATAANVGAVNVITITNGRTKGYNTDMIGFQRDFEDFIDYRSSKHPVAGPPARVYLQNQGGSLRPRSPERPIDGRALVLGTGGASLAILEALHQLDIATSVVSRTPAPGQLGYDQLTPDVMRVHRYVIDCTPLGSPYRPEEYPALPYAALTERHYCYDLVYTPPETPFLRKAAQQGAAIRNGLGMLHGQAEAAWEIWRNE